MNYDVPEVRKMIGVRDTQRIERSRVVNSRTSTMDAEAGFEMGRVVGEVHSNITADNLGGKRKAGWVGWLFVE